jgi:hypothetical protein
VQKILKNNLPVSPMTIGKANRTIGVNRSIGRLGYDNGIKGLTFEARKASPAKLLLPASYYHSSPRKSLFNDY